MSNVTPETIKALAEARNAIEHMGTALPEHLSGLYTNYAHLLVTAFNALDNAGVFADQDEATDYKSAEDILAEAALASVPNTLDPAEWGDTTSADVARRQGLLPVSGLGVLERVPGTDVLRPVHEHAFRAPRGDEVCTAVHWCTVTYGDQFQADRSAAPVCTCGAADDFACTC